MKNPVSSTRDMTIVSYIPKRNKNVLLISSLHHDDMIDAETKKPEMIIDYIGTKGGVDRLDKMCAAYDCARNTRRWPMVIFYSLLNIAGINSMVYYKIQTKNYHDASFYIYFHPNWQKSIYAYEQ